ncbi:MAG: BMP family protein [Armatimonadetes bacterium]|nr:BMP family protein [Armatimonadota bacterium]
MRITSTGRKVIHAANSSARSVGCSAWFPVAPPGSPSGPLRLYPSPQGTTNAPGTQTADANAPALAPEGKPFRVALLTAGPISDAGWNAGAYEGLQAIKKELGAEVSHQQTKSPAEFEAAFRDFAQQGYDVIFAHGNEYGDPALKIAKDYPNTTFVISAGGVEAPNVISIVYDLGQATYLMGEIGALMSKTGKLGAVGGVEIPSVKSTFISYEGGAKAAKPSTAVTTAYLGSWEDQNAAKQQTVALINAGHDILIHNADQAGLGVIQAVRENKEKGVFIFGTNKNQNDLAPEVMLASATIAYPEAFLNVAREVKNGKAKGRIEYLGLKEGVVGLEYNPALKPKIPDTVIQKVEQDKAAIIAGTLQVPRGKL